MCIRDSFYSISAQLKAVIDRTVARWLEVKDKEFYYITTMADEMCIRDRQNVVKHVAIFPASHYIVSADKKAAAIEKIRAECDEQVKKFTAEGKLIEAQRIQQRTNYDIEMLTEVGICKGIENYSAVLSGRAPGSMPTTLLDYFPGIFCFLWMRAM